MPLAAVLLPLLLVLGASPPASQGQDAASHNITAILAAHPEFADFSAALVSTGAAAEINRRRTITVLAVDNAVMARLKAQKPEPREVERVIYLHVLLDYFDTAKLGSIRGGFAQVTSLYQASGKAQGSEGIVNITVFRDGRVAAFTPSAPSNRLPTAFYQRSIKEMPYDIAVLQVKDLIWSPEPADGVQAPAPAPAPQPDSAPELTDLLSKNGCGGFAGLLATTADAVAKYDRSAGAAAGLTVFCPDDKAVEAFNSTFKSLTTDAQLAFLLYHGLAEHYWAQSLKAINGDVSTLAADGSKNHEYNLTVRADGNTVTLSSASASAAATVTKTLVDKARLAVYLIDAVLLPRELSHGTQGRTAPVPAPAPASSPAHAPTPALAPSPTYAPVSPPPAHAPTPTPSLAPAPGTAPAPRRRPAPSPEHTSPAPSPDADGQPPADQKNNGARATASSWTLGAAAVAATVFLLW